MAPGAIKSENDRNTVDANEKSDQATFNAAKVELKSKDAIKEGMGGGKTFARQHELPKLPVPKLEDTCQRYLTSLQPLQVSVPPSLNTIIR
jgi:carnitine O-acetyltransferase